MQLRAILNHAPVYRFFTSAVGGRARNRFCKDHIRAHEGDRVLDLGCGPADILELLPPVDYTGFDTNPAYIEDAKKRWANRGTFICAPVRDSAAQLRGSFDIVLAVGVLHHLDDDEAGDLFRTAFDALRPGGRLVTLDGVFVRGQSPIAHLLLSKDRGEFVRQQPAYERLARDSFAEIDAIVTHNLLWPVPYTHIILECVRPDAAVPKS